MRKKINKIPKKKINKIRKSNFSDRLKKFSEVKVIDESYIFTFGQLKGFDIREAIIADFKYVDWCVQQKIFTLNESLQKHFDAIVDLRTFDPNEECEWIKIFDD